MITKINYLKLKKNGDVIQCTKVVKNVLLFIIWYIGYEHIILNISLLFIVKIHGI